VEAALIRDRAAESNNESDAARSKHITTSITSPDVWHARA